LKLKSRALGSFATEQYANIRNFFSYGNKLGKPAEQLLKEKGSWVKVLESVGETSKFYNKLAN